MTTTEPAFRIPDDVRELLPTHLQSYELPADPSTDQILAAWDVQGMLDGEAGAWLRTAVRRPESANRCSAYAQRIAVVSQALADAIRAADTADNLKG